MPARRPPHTRGQARSREGASIAIMRIAAPGALDRGGARRLVSPPAAPFVVRANEVADGRTRILRLRHPGASCGAAPGPRTRRARRADLPDHVLRVPRYRRRRVAVQPGAPGASLFADQQPDGGGARGASGGARGRGGERLHGERTGGAAPRRRHADGGRRPHRRLEIDLWRQLQRHASHLAAFRDRDDLRGPARP